MTQSEGKTSKNHSTPPKKWAGGLNNSGKAWALLRPVKMRGRLWEALGGPASQGEQVRRKPRACRAGLFLKIRSTGFL